MAGSSSKRRAKQRRGEVDPELLPPSEPIPHTWEKDEEELELEEKLFGRSRKRAKGSGSKLPEEDQIDDEDGGEEIDFDNLFTVDAPLASGHTGDDDSDDDEGSHAGVEDNDDPEEEEEDAPEFGFEAESGSDAESGTFGAQVEPSSFMFEEKGPNAPRISVPANVVDAVAPASASERRPESRALWVDHADEAIEVDLESNKRLKKLGRGKGEKQVVTGKELEEKLRRQYETLHPRPQWADMRSQAGIPSMSNLLTSTKSFIDKPKGRKAPLASGTIEMQRLRNANQQNPTTGKREAQDAGNGVVDFAWHPSARVGVLAVAGGDRRVRFFNVDGHTNPTLMTLHIPSLPLTKTTFHPSGSSILLTGTRPFYYTYDLASQRCLRSPRNLFGSVPDPTSPNSLDRHAFSPDGSLLAVAGRRGVVSVLDWSGTGTGGVVADLRSGRGASVAGMVWSADGRELSVLGGRDGAEVEVWNVGERRVVRKWQDDRAFGGCIMESSRGGEYQAIGSSTGIVNVYSSSSLKQGRDSLDIRPEPVKSLEHLTTPISSLAFNHSAELLVTASQTKRNQLKLYHLPSMSAYQNWPAPTVPFKRISSVGFSAGGEYFAAGNQAGAVLLWRVKHYGSQ